MTTELCQIMKDDGHPRRVGPVFVVCPEDEWQVECLPMIHPKGDGVDERHGNVISTSLKYPIDELFE